MSFIPLILSLTSQLLSLSPTNAATPYTWANESGTTISQSGESFNFEASIKGSSAILNQPVLLDGFSFDYRIPNAKSGQRAGFYFSNAGSTTNCVFTFAPSLIEGDSPQTRFGIFPNDPSGKSEWFGAQPLNQITPTDKLGFGLDDSLVLNYNTDINLNLNFTFKLIGPFYKITIRQLSNNLIWPANANYTSDSKGDYVTTYVETKNISTNSGYANFHEFCYSNSSSPTTVSISNIKETTENTVKVTYHYNQFIYQDSSKKPVVQEVLVEKNTLLTQPETSDNPGYRFAGWYSDSFLTTKWDFENNRVNNDLHLYAKWVTEESEIDPNSDGKITGKVYQLSMPAFICLCILGALCLIPLGFLISFCIKKIALKIRGKKLLK